MSFLHLSIFKFQRIPQNMDDEDKENFPCITRIDVDDNANLQPNANHLSKWLSIAIYAVFLLGGQILATFLGRQYFDHGGKSKWMATFVQNAGFPVAISFLFIPNSENRAIETTKPSYLILAGIYTFLGIILAGDSMLFSIGLQYLPISTYTLIVATQLGFNAMFSALLKLEKLTIYVINSAVLLTISSIILVLDHDVSGQTNKSSSSSSKDQYIRGFICTLLGSAGYALMLSLTQLAFQKIIKTRTFKAVLDMSIYQCLVATVVVLIGLFASGEWKTIGEEMEGFRGGKVMYVNNLVWTAVSWQIFTVGSIGLIFKVTSLFSNAISLLGVPIAPVLAVFFYHDKMSGAKVISAILAIWGFLSYIYQNYLDELEDKEEREEDTCEDSGVSISHST